jgi:hypothetical protein
MAISCTAHHRGVREPLVRTRRSSRCPRASGGHGCYTERPLRPMRARRILASRRSRAASATRCRPHAPRFRGWRSLDRTLPTSDVSCRAARTAAPAPTGWQLRTRRARTIAGPRRLPSCRAIPASSSFPDAAEPKFLALACDRSSVKSRSPVRRLCHRNARQCPRGDFRPAMRPVFTERQRCVSTDFCFPSLLSSTRVSWLLGSFLADGARGIWRFTAPKPLRRTIRLHARAFSSRRCRTIEPLTSRARPRDKPEIASAVFAARAREAPATTTTRDAFHRRGSASSRSFRGDPGAT